MLKKIIGFTLISSLLSLFLTGCGRDPEQDPYEVIFTATPIQIDGLLDEAVWSKAKRLPVEYVFRGTKGDEPSRTRVQLAWSRTHLYVGFTCMDDDIWSYSNQRDAELWKGDLVEIFFKPSATELSYVELAAAPNGALYDALYPSRGAGGLSRFKSWDSETEVGALVKGTDGDLSNTDNGYVVEMSIPIRNLQKNFSPDSTDNSWTFAAFRYDYSKTLQNPLQQMTMTNSTFSGFHHYEGYAPMEFVK